MARDRPHVLLVNPESAQGKTRAKLPAVERELDQHRISFRTVFTRGLEHGVDEALAAAEAEEIPIVMSGDGLLGQIGGALARSSTPLGIVPGGRGNDLARVLGIPAQPAGAARVLAQGHEREIDVAEVNDRRFLCIASAGLDSEANAIANRARIMRGNLVYAYAAIRALIGWRHATFTVTLDGERHRYKGFSIAAANSKAYGGGMFLAPDAELDDGLFDVVMISEYGKLRALANLPKVFKGTHVERDEVTVLRGSKVEITASRRFAVYADGEHITDLPARLRVLPRALRVIAPAAGPPTR